MKGKKKIRVYLIEQEGIMDYTRILKSRSALITNFPSGENSCQKHDIKQKLFNYVADQIK